MTEIEETFKSFLRRPDIEIILITVQVANQIRNVINQRTQMLPVVLEIPSKDSPYNPDTDPIMIRAKSNFIVE